jgi:hypothetical protein
MTPLPSRQSRSEATMKTDRETHVRNVKRNLGDDAEWNALLERVEQAEDSGRAVVAERLLQDIRNTLLSHRHVNDVDLRMWVEAIAERIDRDRQLHGIVEPPDA